MGSKKRVYPPIQFGKTGDEAKAEFTDYEFVGKKIVEWAQNPDTWPTSIDELRKELGGHLTIPPKVKVLKVIQGDDHDPKSTEFILRLPPKNQVSESEKIVRTSPNGAYELPPLYTEYKPGEKDEDGKVINRLRAFYARVGDYTMRGCR
jgi:hypothetical protein